MSLSYYACRACQAMRGLNEVGRAVVTCKGKFIYIDENCGKQLL